jgi:phosphoglycolate phosphatase-like HAD superfamily hydrolase
LLHSVRARGDVAIGLLTGNLREGARRKLTHYGLWDWFPFGGFGDEHMQRCDIAAAALAAADAHLEKRPGTNGKPTRQIVVIGDTTHDVECGRSINARCVAVPTGNICAAALRDSRPDVLVETLEDVPPIIALFDT